MSNPGLKRYDFYNPGSIPLVQSDNGQYVLFSDVEHLVEALKFYANRMSYSLDDYRGISGEMSYRNILHGDMEEVNCATQFAGRRARQALIKVSESYSKIGIGK